MDGTPSHDPADISATLGLDRASSRRGRAWRWGLVVFALAVALAAGWYLRFGSEQTGTPQYVTAIVERGDIKVTVTATGTLQPTNDVDISSELSGIVRAVLVDYNDRVKAGQILAVLDRDKLQAEVAHARATLAANQAGVELAKASLTKARLDFDRYRHLVESKTVSEQQFEQARATYDQAAASLDSAEANVATAQADLTLNETNLEKASIRSPIDGVVLNRNVNPGQTVATTLQAPVLFTIAEDLRVMELQVDVDEADVGLVAAGQAAQFTVDAYPDRSFPATVTRVRYAPQTTEGVVTYTTDLSVDNSDLLLRPGMTATAEISARTVKNALLIPNEALRFSPPRPAAAKSGGGLVSSILPHPPPTSSSPAPSNVGTGNQRRLRILQGGKPVAVNVLIGLSDGAKTEITGGELKAGQAVILDLEETGS